MVMDGKANMGRLDLLSRSIKFMMHFPFLMTELEMLTSHQYESFALEFEGENCPVGERESPYSCMRLLFISFFS